MLKKAWKILGTMSVLLTVTLSAKAYTLLALSDPHYSLYQQYKMALSPKQGSAFNDLDPATLMTLLDGLKQSIDKEKLAKPDAILLLGDSVHHGLLVSAKEKNATLKNYYGWIKKTFPTTPILSVFGNNDSLSAHYGPYSQGKLSAAQSAYQAGFNSPFLYRPSHHSSSYPQLIIEDKSLGAFMVKLNAKQGLIGLNSVLFSKKRSGSGEREQRLQLAFLGRALKNAKKEHLQMSIAMHIPVGKSVYDGKYYWTAKAREGFFKLMKAYQNTVNAIFVGHTHKDELKIIRDKKGLFIPELFTAALSTSHNNLPSAKYFYFENGQLSDYQTLVYEKENGQYAWKTRYSLMTTYCAKKPVKTIKDCLESLSMKQSFQFYNLKKATKDNRVPFPQYRDIDLTH